MHSWLSLSQVQLFKFVYEYEISQAIFSHQRKCLHHVVVFALGLSFAYERFQVKGVVAHTLHNDKTIGAVSQSAQITTSFDEQFRNLESDTHLPGRVTDIVAPL